MDWSAASALAIAAAKCAEAAIMLICLMHKADLSELLAATAHIVAEGIVAALD